MIYMTQRITSNEFLDKIQQGQKEFSHIEIDCADMSGKNFSGLHIKNSKFVFVALRNCNFNDVVFENCEINLVTMGYSTFNDTSFIKCNFDYAGFSWCNFQNTKITKSTLHVITMLEANTGGLDIIDCVEFDIFRNIFQ